MRVWGLHWGAAGALVAAGVSVSGWWPPAIPRPGAGLCILAALLLGLAGWIRTQWSARLDELRLELLHDLDGSERLQQFAADLTQLRASMQELRIERVHLESALNALPHDLAQAQENATREAVFRLAASLDQLHARFDQRMDHMQEHVDARLAAWVPAPAAALPAEATRPADITHGAQEKENETRSPVGLGLLDSFQDN
jgi:hypothetical protein